MAWSVPGHQDAPHHQARSESIYILRLFCQNAPLKDLLLKQQLKIYFANVCPPLQYIYDYFFTFAFSFDLVLAFSFDLTSTFSYHRFLLTIVSSSVLYS